MIERLMPYLLVGAGSFVGGNARYILGRWVGGLIDARFPLGTFLVNVLGSFLLGFLAGLLATRALPHSDSLRLALGVGFCGGFTTFSTPEHENHPLLEDGLCYVRDSAGSPGNDPGGRESIVSVPDRLTDQAIAAALDCPGECIFLEDEALDDTDDSDVSDADVVDMNTKP